MSWFINETFAAIFTLFPKDINSGSAENFLDCQNSPPDIFKLFFMLYNIPCPLTAVNN